MKQFVALYTRLDETTKTNAKVEALVDYFTHADPKDAIWALSLLAGRRIRRPVASPLMRQWAADAAGIPLWLFEECYDAVGDLGETIALLVAQPTTLSSEDKPLHYYLEQVLLKLGKLPEAQQRQVLLNAWAGMSTREAFLLNKLIGGSFRVGVSHQIVIKALARVSGNPEPVLSHRLMGDWPITADFYRALFTPDDRADLSRPYPFYLAYALEEAPETLGAPEEWQAEWKWDGIRAQLIHRAGQVYLWSRGEELITERFPELAAVGKLLPEGTVLDGEVLPGAVGAPLPFASLQRRIGRKELTKKILQEVPVYLLTYDLLEQQGHDIRELPIAERRARLVALLAQLPSGLPLGASPIVRFTSWVALSQTRLLARSELAEGLMLKRLSSPYRTGRRRGDWYKWKVAPYSLDAVLVAAQRGTGRRASLYTDYTFAVWDGPKLVTFAKAYSGLTDEEIAQVDSWVRHHTMDKFGPVRTVEPVQVFELAFEGLQRSTRHKSGVAVRFPRILRWRQDKPAAEADTLAALQALLQLAAQPYSTR